MRHLGLGHAPAWLLLVVLSFAILASGGTVASAAAPSRSVDATLEPDSLAAILPPEGSVAGLLVGSALLESGDVQSALSYYGYLHRADPDNPLLAERFIEVALRAGQPKEALAALDRLLEHERTPEHLAQKVRLLLLLRRTEEADEVVDELLSLDPGDLEARELRLSVWIELEDWPAAARELQSRLVDDPDDADLHRRLGEVLLQTNDREGAEAELRESFELDPTDERVVARLSELLVPDRSEELKGILERFVAAVPDATVEAARLADLYLSANEPERAVDLLIPLVRGGHLEVRAEIVLAQLLTDLDRRDEALGILREREAVGPASAPRQRLMGELSSAAGNRREAERHFERAIELDPSDGETYASYLLLLSSPSDDGESDEQAEVRRERMRELAEAAVASVSPQSLRQNFLVGAVLSRLGRHDVALPLLERAAELAPDDRRTLYELALTQEEVGQDRAAVSTLEKLLELDPEDAEILNFYGYLLAENGWQLDRAERAVQRALAAQPRNGAYLDSLGWVYYQQGRYSEALELLVDATNVLGDDPVILEHLGDCLRELGRVDDARNAYERARAVGGEKERLDARLGELEGRDEDSEP